PWRHSPRAALLTRINWRRRGACNSGVVASGAHAMSYRTILVHINDKRRAETLLQPTIELATRYNSHLIGLHAYASLPAPPIAIPFTAKTLAGVAAAEHENAAQIAALFSRMAERRQFVADWQLFEVFP